MVITMDNETKTENKSKTKGKQKSTQTLSFPRKVKLSNNTGKNGIERTGLKLIEFNNIEIAPGKSVEVEITDEKQYKRVLNTPSIIIDEVN